MKIISVKNEDDLNKLGEEIKTILVSLSRKGIIGIDGATQCGKSIVITNFLGYLLKAKIIDLDCFIKINEKDILYQKKDLFIKENKWYVADGILNKKILKKYKIKALLNIYVKKISIIGWVERGWLDKGFIKDYGLDNLFMQSDIDRQIYDYHNEYNPVETADLIVEVAEEYLKKLT